MALFSKENPESLKRYELMLIFSSEIPANVFDQELTEIRDFLKKNTDGIFFEDIWGLRAFAYNIKKLGNGYYAILYFNADPEKIGEVQSTIRLNTRILRYILLSLPEGVEPKKVTEDDLSFVQEKRTVRKLSRNKKVFDVKSGPRKIITEKIGKTAEIGEDKSFEDKSFAKDAKPLLSGKTEEEKLKSVEKTLESILDNPDIELK